MILTTKTAIPNKTLIRNIKNPEWGIWRILQDKTSLTIEGDRGGKILIDDEYKDWEIVTV